MPRYSFSRLFPIYGANLYTSDLPLQQVLKFFNTAASSEKVLQDVGQIAGTEVLEVADYVDRLARPLLHQSDVWGQRMDWVRIAPAHQNLLDRLLSLGIVYRTFRDQGAWPLHYAMGYLVSDPGLYCTLTVTNQTAYGIFKYGAADLRERFLPHYLEQDGRKAWFGATYYTETQGGSDLGANRAQARPDGGRWRINSVDKYFTSNVGLADAALVTARPEGAPAGPRGLALFLVPALREDGSPNYRIRRLKEKLATRAVPTGEVEMEDAEAYLLGEASQGIYLALEVLSVARLANAVGALGNARKAQLAAYAYAKKRHTFGRSLVEHPLIQKDLLEMELLLQGNLLLAFYAVDRFQAVWQQTPPYSPEFWYARFLNHLSKNVTAQAGVEITRRAMEMWGGIGFMEDFPLARFHREALVMPIWEGGSHIQALDMLETLVRKQVHQHWREDMVERLNGLASASEAGRLAGQALEKGWQQIQQVLQASPHQAQYQAGQLLNRLAQITAAVLYLQWAEQQAERLAEVPWNVLAESFLRWQLHGRAPAATLAEKVAELYSVLFPGL